MNQKTPKSDELVTDRAKVTGCDGLPVLNWRRFQLTRKPATTRHYPSPVTNCDLAPSPHKPMTAPRIAEKLGVAEGTVRNDLSGSQICEPDSNARSIGKDGKSYPRRLRWADVPHSNPPRPTVTTTDPAKVLLAEECASILATFGNAASMTRRGDWLIHGTRYSHAQALALAARVVARRNGEPVEVTPAKYFDAGAAYRANELVERDAVIEIQEPELVEIVPPVSEVKA